MESTRGNWTRIALAVLLASASQVSFAKARSDVDARHCLDLGSNAAIIQCAEQYRPGGARSSGKSRRHAAPPAAAAPAAAPPPAPAAAPAPAPAPATQVAAGVPNPSAESAPAPAPKRRGRKHEVDARHCLDRASLREIARCAEKYR